MSDSLSPDSPVVVDSVPKLLSLAKARAALMQSEVCRFVAKEETHAKELDWTRRQIVEYLDAYNAAVNLLRTLGFEVEVNDSETREALCRAEWVKQNALPY